ncbi:MAG: Ig domain-containing protein [Gemmatimonadaceae bacterium]|nr:Ig domain-containing protein [Gemmatimonadaceae bacterium]
MPMPLIRAIERVALRARRRRLRTATAGALAGVLFCACDSPAKPIPVASVAVSPSAPSVIVGTPQQFTATARDAQGGALTGRAVTWSSLSPNVATISTSGLVTTISPGVVTIQATIEGVAGSTPLTVMPFPVATVTVSPSNASVIAGQTQGLSVTLRDAQGGLLTDRVVLWSSSAPTIATVASNGTVTALTPGTAVIEASSEGKSATATITVLPVPVATVSVTLPVSVINIGATVQAVGTPLDANGAALSGRPVTWSVSNPSIATISANGLVTALTAGSFDVRATTEGITGSRLLRVQSSDVAIQSISPATLTPGATATIAVAGVSATPAATVVTFGGVAAAVVSASATQIVATVPCVRSGNAVVQVSAETIAPISRSHPVSTTQRSVGLGQAVVVSDAAGSRCNELVSTGGPARFLVAVFSVATSQNTLDAFDLVGNPAAASVAVPRVVSPLASFAATRVEPVSEVDRVAARYDAQHAAMLERNRSEYERLMRAVRALPAAAQTALRTRARETAADVAPGDMRSIFFTFTGGCNDTTRVIRGKAIFVGTRTIVWEDSANTLQSANSTDLASYYDRAARIYDQEQHASVTRAFGDPLLRDAVTDNDGKIHMVFSQRLNGSGAAAYVSSCDQFPTTVAAGSNFGQFFYGQAPTTATLNINSTNSPDGWFYFMTRTIVHEVKHIASLSARVANGSPSFEQSWLEEGTARHAEEMWVRQSLHQVNWKANTGFGTASTNGLYCDFHPTDATCNGADALRRPSYGMRRQFNEIRDKLLQPWNWSPFGDATGQSGSIFYQTTWSLVRYLADRYAADDEAFLRTLTNSTATGLTNLSAATGASVAQMLGAWGLALYADDYPGLAAPSPDIQFPTWNLRNIYAGLNAAPAWSGRWNTPFPIQPAPLSYGSFVSSVPAIRGGAHAYFELTGNFTQPQLLDVRALNGTGSNLRIAITRLQ